MNKLTAILKFSSQKLRLMVFPFLILSISVSVLSAMGCVQSGLTGMICN